VALAKSKFDFCSSGNKESTKYLNQEKMKQDIILRQLSLSKLPQDQVSFQ
jgi:hypothetical protein